MSHNPVNWFEIYVDDMPRARGFYEAVFAITLEKLEGIDVEMYRFPSDRDGPGTSGSLVHMPGFKASGNSTIVYFYCEDSSVEEARVVPAGGKIFKSKFSIGQYGFIALATDTEGNMIGLHSLK